MFNKRINISLDNERINGKLNVWEGFFLLR